MAGTQLAAGTRPDKPPAAAASRLGWMDTLRVTAIAGVIVMHAGTAYILDIDWYYQERTTSALTPTLAAFPALIGGLFGLGPLFLLGGLLSAASLGRKDPGGFARGRLLRLGLPLLAFVVLLDPLTDYLGALAEGEHPRLWPYLIDQTGTRDTGPLWFVALLLLCSLAYAGLRGLRPGRARVTAAIVRRYLVAAAAGIAAGSFAVRLVSPLGEETFANLRWEAWPQGIGLFTLGVLAGERGWLEAVDRRLVRGCGWAAVAAVLGLTALAAWALVTDRLDAVAGGLAWPSAAFAVLEGLGAVALSLWVGAWFRRRWDRPGRLVQRAGRGSYAAYVLHPPVLVMLSMLARPLPMAPEAKFALVAVSGVAASFAVGVGLTRLQMVARLL
jgi:glucans biosynthesis protein C